MCTTRSIRTWVTCLPIGLPSASPLVRGEVTARPAESAAETATRSLHPVSRARLLSTTHRTPRDFLGTAIIGAAAIWLLLTALPATGRPGYSADEEVTALVISSSSPAGVPRLPSGIAYLRGPLYVKFADVAGALLSHDLQAYRMVSLIFGLANVLLIAMVAKAWLPSPAAPVAAVLLAVSPLHAAASVFARPYTAAIFCLLAGCLAMRRALDGPRAEWTFLVLAFVSQAVHESAVLFAMLPFAYGMVQENDDVRRRAWWLGAKTAAIAALVQGLSGAWFSASLSSVLGSVDRPMAVFVLRTIPWPPLDLPALARGPGIGTAVVLFGALAIVLRRATGLRWLELLAGAGLGGLFLLGPLAAATLLSAVAQPRRARATLAAGVTFGLTSSIFWTMHTTLVTDAALTWRVGIELTRTALFYSLDWALLVAQRYPAMAGCIVIAAIAAAYARAPVCRFAVVVAGVLLTTFGLLAIVPHDRYLVLLLPFALLPAAAGIVQAGRLVEALCSSVRPGALATGAGVVAMSAAAVVVALEQRAYAGGLEAETESVANAGVPDGHAPQTYFADRATHDCLRAVPATDLLVCNDELACTYLAGRVDAWLLPDPEVRRVCAVERNGLGRGMYAGSQVLADGDALAQLISASAGRVVTVALVATPKFGYPEQVAIAAGLARSAGVSLRPCGSSGQIVRFDR